MAKLKLKSGNSWVTGTIPVKIIEGSDNTSDSIQVMNNAVKGYIENVTYTFADINAYDDDDYDTSSVSTYVDIATNGGYRGDEPNGVSITLSASGDYDIIDTKQQKIQEIENKSGTFTQYNLTPNSKTFYNHVKNSEIINSGVIYPTGQVRMFKTNTAYSTFKSCNFRDIGGWTCDGGTIKYGKIIRGSRLNGGSVTTSNDDKKMLRDFVGIKYEIDLRGDGTNGSSDEAKQTINGQSVKITWSALGDDIGYSNYPIRGYKTGINLANATGQASAVHYKNAIKTIINCLKENKPIYLHCMAGADRTGTMSFIIETICGVSRSDLDKDYEMTSFCNYQTSQGPYTGNNRQRNLRTDYQSFIEYFFDNYTGDSFRDRVIGWCLDIGLTYDDINDLRNLLIDGNPSPITPPATVYEINSTLTHASLGNSATEIEEGEIYTSLVTPDSNYEVSTVTVTMNNVAVQNAFDSATNTITVSNVTGDLDITVVATLIPTSYRVTALLSHATLSNNATSIQEGQTYTTTVIPDTGYEISYVSVYMNGSLVQNAFDDTTNTITVANVTGELGINVTATESATVTHSITLTTDSHVSGNGIAPISVDDGDSYTNTLTVDSGFEMESISVYMGSTDITSTTYTSATGVISIASVTDDVVITARTYGINILTTAFTTHGQSYEAIGYENGKRLSGSTGALTADEACFVTTGYIPIVDGDEIVVRGVTFPEASNGDGKQYLAYYKSNKNKVLVITIRLNPDGSAKTFTGAYTISKDTSTGSTVYTIKIGLGTYSSTDTTDSVYARISCIGVGENARISLNE